MAEKITAELELKTNAGEAGEEVEEFGKKAKKASESATSLRTQVRETVQAMQKLEQQGKATGKEYEDLRAKLDDLNDTQDRAKFKAGQFEDKLASLPGPLGQIGSGLKTAGDSFATFGKTLTISLGIFGLLVAAFVGIKEALSKTKEGTAALSAVTSALNKVMAPFFALLERVGLAVLPIITKGFEALGTVMNKVAQFFGADSKKIQEVTASLEENNEYAQKLAEDEKKRLEDLKKKRLQIRKHSMIELLECNR
jgi:methyl-accepting chemotaxis protein